VTFKPPKVPFKPPKVPFKVPAVTFKVPKVPLLPGLTVLAAGVWGDLHLDRLSMPNPSPTPPSPASEPSNDTLRDIGPLLASWDYKPGTLNVRKIVGLDGRAKIQMRLDLGLFQMELTGRPDGLKPHDCESLLDYHERQLDEHRKLNGNELGFHLSPPQCEALRQEASMYYHRYLSLFVLEEFPGVITDTQRNLRVLDLCGKYAVDDRDRIWLEQYRPYILMMNARATASIHLKGGNTRLAYVSARKGLRQIKEFFERFQQPQAYKHSPEAKALRRFVREIKAKLPTDPKEALRAQLERAIAAERYEEAARLRDELAKLE
jgi:hypothetical protein